MIAWDTFGCSGGVRDVCAGESYAVNLILKMIMVYVLHVMESDLWPSRWANG